MGTTLTVFLQQISVQEREREGGKEGGTTAKYPSCLWIVQQNTNSIQLYSNASHHQVYHCYANL
jgi:hypothetical protein